MINHDIILDLMMVYQSGEASQSTIKLVEEHLGTCLECKEAYEQALAIEHTLAEIEPYELHPGERKIVFQLKRLGFSLGAGLLFTIFFGVAFVTRGFLQEVLGISNLQFEEPRNFLLLIGLGSLLIGIQMVLLRWRISQNSTGRISSHEYFLSLASSVPILIFGLGLVIVDLVGVAVLSAFLLGCLVLIYRQIHRAPYLTLSSITLLLVDLIFVLIRAVLAFSAHI